MGEKKIKRGRGWVLIGEINKPKLGLWTGRREGGREDGEEEMGEGGRRGEGVGGGGGAWVDQSQREKKLGKRGF